MLTNIKITVPTPPGLNAADFYVTSNAEMTALMTAQGVAGLSGKTIAIHPGNYAWDITFWNSRAYTSETTFIPAFDNDRPVFLCGANYDRELRSPTNLTLRKLKFHAVWDYGVHGPAESVGSGIRIKNNVNAFRIDQCEFYSDLRQIVADHGYPSSMADVTYKGLLGADGTTEVITGGYYITDCTFHGSWRLLMIPNRAVISGGPTEIIGNRFYDQGVDSLFISGPHDGIKINWNHFDSPLNGWDGSDIEVTCDPVLNRFTSVLPHGLTGTSTMNLSPNMITLGGTPPIGIGYSVDFTVTRIDDNTLSIAGVDPTTAGSGVRIYREPAHADFLQTGTGGNSNFTNFELIGNSITIARYDALESKRNCQAIFMEDINNDANDLYHYSNGVIFGNLIYTHSGHGISLYNPVNCRLENNICVGLNTATGNGPPVAVRQQAGGTASGNTMKGNIAHTTTAFSGTSIAMNVNKSLTAGNIDDELVDTVLEPNTRAQMIAYFALKAGGAADLQSPKAGGPGSGHIDYAARTYTLPTWP